MKNIFQWRELMSDQNKLMIAIQHSTLPAFLSACGLVLLLGFMLFASSTGAAELTRQDQIKAGLIYKFTSFIDWPEDVSPDRIDEGQFIIGVMESEAMVEAFVPVLDTLVKGHRLSVIKLAVDSPESDLRRCHIIYLGDSLEDEVDAIVSRLDGYPVVTVSSMESFIEHGGIIGFREDKSRIKFVINMRAARQGELRFRAKLLRVAIQVIGVENGS